ncbi:MAG TPA: hypothetical protein VF507_10695, partial [Pyrinomonadaceae bacterium]
NAWTLYLPDGTRVVRPGPGAGYLQRVYDRNGNYTEVRQVTLPGGDTGTQIVDQLGRAITLSAGADGDHITTTGPNGEDVTWVVKWKEVWVYKSYLATLDPLPQGESRWRELREALPVVDTITTPAQAGSLVYRFDYNGSATQPTAYTSGLGEVSSLTLPSGAKVTYQYQMDGLGQIPGWENVLQDSPTQKDLLSRAEYDLEGDPSNAPCTPQTCGTETWTYSVGATTGSVTSPDGGTSAEYFYSTQPGVGQVGSFSGLSYMSVRPDGTTVERVWQANYPYGTTATNPYVKTEFTSLKDGSGNLVKTAIRDYGYDKNGNVTRVAEYDWAPYSVIAHDSAGRATGFDAGQAAQYLKRVTTSVYYNQTPDASDTATNDGSVYIYASSPRLRSALKSSEVSNGSQALARGEYFYDDPATTGNLTQQKSWDSGKGAYSNPLGASNSVSVSRQYDAYGNVTLATDARGSQTRMTYGSVGGFTDLYPTEVKEAYGAAVERTATKEYDFNTGLVRCVTDADNGVSTLTSYDALGRPTLVKAAEGKPEETRTATQYSDSLRRVIVRSDLEGVGDGKLVSVQHFDQLGRVRLARQLEDASTQSASDEKTGVKVQTRYKYGGAFSYQLVSNPYRADSSAGASGEATMGWTLTKADNAGRVVAVQSFAGSSLPAPWGNNGAGAGTVTTSYDTVYTTVTDQAGKQRRSETDALGRLIRVFEDPSGLNYQTDYQYDALGDLTTVTQGAQTRSFLYDSLKRLTSATNPESGTVSYPAYDGNGNLLQKTDARGVSITYTYDELS